MRRKAHMHRNEARNEYISKCRLEAMSGNYPFDVEIALLDLHVCSSGMKMT